MPTSAGRFIRNRAPTTQPGGRSPSPRTAMKWASVHRRRSQVLRSPEGRTADFLVSSTSPEAARTSGGRLVAAPETALSDASFEPTFQPSSSERPRSPGIRDQPEACITQFSPARTPRRGGVVCREALARPGGTGSRDRWGSAPVNGVEDNWLVGHDVVDDGPHTGEAVVVACLVLGQHPAEHPRLPLRGHRV